MKRKTKILAATPAILTATLAAFIAFYSPSDFAGKLESVQNAQVGELVVLKASPASSYKWQVLPDNANYKLIDKGRSLIFSALVPGDYIFVCAMAKDDSVELVVHKVIVTPYKINVTKQLVGNFRNKELAAALKRAASEATTIEELISKSAEYNSQVSNLEECKPFLQRLSDYCKINMSNSSLEDHKTLWNNIASALEQ